MSDIDVYGGGDLAPYSPGGLDLFTPDAESHWGDLTPDYLSTPGQQVANINDPQVQANIQQIATVFESDMASLGFVQKDIQACIGFFKSMLANPPTSMPAKKHSYQMWQFSHDIQFMAFCNFAATQRFAPELIQSVAYWLQQLEDWQAGVGRFAGAKVQPRVSSNPEDQLTDAQWDQVVVANERAYANTLGRLKDLWGQSFQGNIRVVQQHFASLTPAEQEHLSQFTGNWIRGTNTFEIVTSLYAQAVQAHTIPRNGAAIAQELQNIERYMKERRSAYMKDETTQARYRELLNLRDGGR